MIEHTRDNVPYWEFWGLCDCSCGKNMWRKHKLLVATWMSGTPWETAHYQDVNKCDCCGDIQTIKCVDV